MFCAECCSVVCSLWLVILQVVFVESLLARYLNAHAFTHLHLDGIFKYGDDNTLPLEVKVVFLLHVALLYIIYIAYLNLMHICNMMFLGDLVL